MERFIAIWKEAALMPSELIRRCTPADAQALAAIYDPIVAETHISFEYIPPGPSEMRHRITTADDFFPWLLLERDGGVVGYAYASAHRSRFGYRWSVEVSAYVAPTARRQGAARRLYTDLFQILAAQGYHAAFAGVTLPNEPSCDLHRNVGFTVVGVFHAVGFKQGAWRDVMWFERLLRPATEAPSEPLALSAVERA